MTFGACPRLVRRVCHRRLLVRRLWSVIVRIGHDESCVGSFSKPARKFAVELAGGRIVSITLEEVAALGRVRISQCSDVFFRAATDPLLRFGLRGETIGTLQPRAQAGEISEWTKERCWVSNGTRGVETMKQMKIGGRVCVVKMKSLMLVSDVQGWRQGTRGEGMLVSTPVTKPISRCHQLLKMQKNFAIRGRGRRAALLSQARCAWPRHTVPTGSDTVRRNLAEYREG